MIKQELKTLLIVYITVIYCVFAGIFLTIITFRLPKHYPGMPLIMQCIIYIILLFIVGYTTGKLFVFLKKHIFHEKNKNV